MTTITDKIIIENINEGYIWESDKTGPIVILQKSEFENQVYDSSSNPFIVEAQYISKENDKTISHSIKYANGSYYEETTDLDEIGKDFDEIIYNSYRMGGRLLKFRRYWEKVEDPLCEGMKVQKFEKLVFVGFCKSK